ncbi:MAG TPA: M48 family metalloprotease [Frankiaceae bacterium]|nr:M48 family metalloprotease [Frankiaceae bacterium]
MSADARVAVGLTAGVLLILLLVGGVRMAPRLPAYVRDARGAPPAPGDFSDEECRRGSALRRRLRPLTYARMLLGLGLAIAMGATELGADLVETVARPFGGGWLWEAPLGVLALLVLSSLIGLPCDVAGERVLRAAGLSVQSWPSWASDRAKGLLLAGAVSVLLALGGYGLIRALPNLWWIVAALLAAALTVLLSFVFPVLVEPIFSRFRSLPEGDLRNELLAMARHDGVPVRDVLVADASRRTTALNAYVSGFGRTRRIVVFDTLLVAASAEEVRLVVAHELGHAAERDVLRGTALGAVGAALGTLLVALALSSASLLDAVGGTAPGDPRTLGLVLLVGSLLGLVTGPLSNAASRRIETRADLHSLELTHDPVAFVASERRLALTNVADLTPSRLAYLLFASHPAVPERIATARRWAEQHGLAAPGPLIGGGAVPVGGRAER